MLVVLVFSILIGLALGVLGGGGSILTVPVLIGAAGMSPKQDIATSLLVVAVTSLAAVVQHARAGQVALRTGLIFGATAMVGAFLGGLVAAKIPGELLLLLFGVMMLVTAVAMLRGRRGVSDRDTAVPHELPLGRVMIDGLVVGAVTGLVGAGGGFLVVPALVLLGGLPMRRAVGTSLLVIAMKSAAGFLGYAQHVSIDWSMAGLVIAGAVTGTLIGSRLAHRIPQDALRVAFGWFVVVMAAYVLGQNLPDAITHSGPYRAVFVDRWPFWAGGAAIAAVAAGLLYVDNRQLGVSTGCEELCHLRRDRTLRGSWRLRFLGGIVLGGTVAAALSRTAPTLAHGGFDSLLVGESWLKLPVLVFAGVLVGYGARRAGGCTSGHGIVGMAQLAKSSVLATGVFMVAGFVTTALISILAA